MAQGFVQASKHPPEKFRSTDDFSLWQKRFEPYAQQNEITREHWVQELVPLLENEPFRLLHQLGLLESTQYDAVIGALTQRYNPIGNELEWQQRPQTCTQKPEETLDDFAVELRLLAEKAYPKWSSDKQQEMARNRFIQSPSIQLLLMKEQPDTLDGALMLARRQLSVEVAQKNLSSTKNSYHLAPIVDKSTSEVLVAPLHGDVKQQEQLAALSKQLQQLTLEMKYLRQGPANFRRTNPRGSYNSCYRQTRITCWQCGKQGHIRRNCTNNLGDPNLDSINTIHTLTGDH